VRRNPLFGVTHFYGINSFAITEDTEEFRLLQEKLLRRRKTAIESAEKSKDAFSADFDSLIGNI
jgi:SAM-dependent MidA family methyltransferase